MDISHHRWNELGVATVYEASGQQGLIQADLVQVVPGSAIAGPARTVRCGQDDNLAVHLVMEQLQPGDVLVLAMPEPRPIALVGELLAVQAKVHGAAGVLIDAAVRDVEGLRRIGLPIWARWVRAAGTSKEDPGQIDVRVEIAGSVIEPGDMILLDVDGGVVVPKGRAREVLEASEKRQEKEASVRPRLEAGELTLDIYGFRREL